MARLWNAAASAAQAVHQKPVLLADAQAGALAPERLDQALRAAFLCAAGRGRIIVTIERARCDASLEMAAISVALVETIRELAVTLDAEQGWTVARDFDSWRDSLMAQMFARAKDAAATQRHQL